MAKKKPDLVWFEETLAEMDEWIFTHTDPKFTCYHEKYPKREENPDFWKGWEACFDFFMAKRKHGEL